MRDMHFRFLALDISNGNVVRGEIYADNPIEAENDIRSNGLDLKLLQEISEKTTEKESSWKCLLRFFTKEKFNNKDKQQFFQQMYILLKSGISIEISLQIINEGCDKIRDKRSVYLKLIHNIRAGKSLSDAMNAVKAVFTLTEINVMRAAEQVGCPEEAMKQLGDVANNIDTIKSKFLLSMIYPCVVLVVTIFVILLLSNLVVPQFQKLFFDQPGIELPFLTKIVIGISEFINANTGMIVLSTLVLIVCYRFLRTKKLFFKVHEQIFLKTPIIKGIIHDYNIYLFAITLSMLLRYGCMLQQSILFTKHVVTHNKIKHTIDDIINKISCGDSVSHALSGILSNVSIGIIVAGENTGKLSESFSEIAEIYRKSLIAKLMLVSALVEPILIIGISILVGITVISIFLPLVNLIQNVNV